MTKTSTTRHLINKNSSVTGKVIMELNILYCSDNNYAPYCGISMLSLLEANRKAESITVYVVSDAISDENVSRLKKTVEAYGPDRHLELVDGRQIVERLKNSGMGSYRGGQTANLRLFFPEYIKSEVHRLLYLDCDTLICDDLCDLFATPMGDHPVAAVRDALTSDYKIQYGLRAEDIYFNSGVLLFDVDNWLASDCAGELQKIFAVPEYRGANNDQDYLNRLLLGRLTLLSPRYNFQTPHYIFRDKTYFSVCPRKNYYSEEELQSARKHPAILHTYRFLGQFPWTGNSLHPAAKQYRTWLARSEWSDCGIAPDVKNRLFKVERILYRTLPEAAFFRLFFKMQNKHFNSELQKRRNA